MIVDGVYDICKCYDVIVVFGVYVVILLCKNVKLWKFNIVGVVVWNDVVNVLCYFG